MGVGRTFGAAFARAQEAGGIKALPASARCSCRCATRTSRVPPVAQELAGRGFSLVATAAPPRGSASTACCECRQQGAEGRPHRRHDQERRDRLYRQHDRSRRGDRRLVLDPPRAPLQQRITYSTTVAGARALVHSLDFRGTGPVWSLQELHKELQA
jgi:carbamoyl-phosphate synthase large subunit